VAKKTVSKSQDDFQLQQLKNGKLSRLFIERRFFSIVNMRPWRQDFKQLQVLKVCLITVAISLLHG